MAACNFERKKKHFQLLQTLLKVLKLNTLCSRTGNYQNIQKLSFSWSNNKREITKH